MILAVSIVTYHTSEAELRSCLDSLASDVVERVHIVDNGSEPRIARIAADYDKVIYTPSANVGFGRAHNLAIRRSLSLGARYHLVLNTDVRFAPEVLPRLVEVMDSRPEVGQLQPRVCYPDGTLQYTVRRLPSPLDVFARRFLPRAIFYRRDDRYLLRHLDHSRQWNVPYHQGSFMLLRTSALREVGLFDERFFMYPEDIDLTRRMHERYVTLYYPGETIVHDHRRESYKSMRLLRIHAINMVKYFNKWGWIFDSSRRRINRTLELEAKKIQIPVEKLAQHEKTY